MSTTPSSSVLTGIWLGQARDGDHMEDLKWCLSLTPEQSFPSAFGAAYEAADDASGGPPLIVPLKGEYYSSTQYLKLTKKRNGNTYSYNGQLSWCVDSGEWSIVGTWRCDDAKNAHGVFGVCREPEAINVVAGLWLGRCVPDPSLADFCIPTNPIKWSLALTANVSGYFSAFGGGFFDDSADVPNSPVLCYSIQGQWLAADSTVSLSKHYEDRSLEHSVEYKGRLSIDDEGMHWLRGEWTNATAGSFGSFECRRSGGGPIASGVCLCDGCHGVISPGQLRWNCVKCVPSWNTCEACYNKDPSSHAHPLAPETVYNVIKVEGQTCAEMVSNAFSTFASLPFLSASPDFKSISYAEAGEIATNFACALRKWGCRQGSLAVVCMESSPLCVHVLLGCLLNGCVVIPVAAVYGVEALSTILSSAQSNIFIVDPQAKSLLLQAIRKSRLEPRLIVEAVEGAATAVDASSPSPLLVSMTMPNFLRAGQIARQAEPFTLPTRAEDDIVAVLFTSGSTGAPKGAVFPEYLALPRGPITTVQPFVRMDFQSFDPAFLLSLFSTMRCGGRRCFSNVTSLLEDIPRVRPTHLGATPVFWNMLYQLHASGQKSCEEIRECLGNRLHVATSGGAAISKEVLEFMRRKVGVDLIDNYGTRETGGIAREGLVYPGVEIELLAVPELGYSPSSSPPQGEVCVCSPQMIPEYFRAPELNEKTFITINGKRFYRTGDIGEIVSRTAAGVRLRIIDRCSAFFKLSHGEWVSQARVEASLELAPFVEQAFLWGSSQQSFCVAVVVPAAAARDWDEKQMLAEIRRWGVHYQLRPFEVPQALLLEREAWTADNGMLTTTWKKNRPALYSRYREALNNLISSSASTAAPVASSSSSSNSSFGGNDDVVAPEVVRALRQVCPGVSFDGSSTLAQLGLDSLSLLLFRNLVPAARKLPVQTLFAYPLSHLSHLLLDDNNVIPLTSLPAIDWASESRLNLESLLPLSSSSASSLNSSDATSTSHSASSRSHILLTGCTGFLGPVLLGELLRRRSDRHVTCLLRGAGGLSRLRQSLELAGCWEESFASRISIVMGDLSKPFFGCTQEQFTGLAEGLTDIFHNGAAVNMLLPYAALRLPNVEGTRFVILLAKLAHAAIHFVSSVSALGPTIEASPDGWLTLSEATLNAKEAYGQTKVIAERLLREAHNQLHLKVRIARPSVICSHSQSGYSNVRDFTLLLLSAIVHLGGAVSGSSVHFQWVPVDEIATKVAAFEDIDKDVMIQNMIGSSVSLLALVEGLRRYYPIKPLTVEEWKERVAALPSSHPAFSLRTVLAEMNFFPPSPPPVDLNSRALEASAINDNMIGFLSTQGVFPPPSYCLNLSCFHYARENESCAKCLG